MLRAARESCVAVEDSMQTLTRGELAFKWSLYAAAALLCAGIQGLFLRRMSIAGVMPFVFPLLAVIPATFENAASGGLVFALCEGVFCDWLLPGGIPCFYTLIFPAAALIACLISRTLLPAGFLCSLAVSSVSFALHGLFHCLLLWAMGHAAWEAGAWTTVREYLVTLPLIIPVTVLFQCVYDRVRRFQW